MISCHELIAKIRPYHPNLDEHLIQKAYILSKTAHGNQKRHSGDPYFTHPLAVAEILVDLKLDQESIITGLLHDVVEDTDIGLDEIEKDFGEGVARLVDGVTKLGKINAVSPNENTAESFRKLTLAMSQDIRVLLVKLADRLHNMRTLIYMPTLAKRLKKARESLDIYAPLAGRIGLNKIKDEIQELAFEIIDPKSRNDIIARLGELREKNESLISKIVEDLNDLMQREGLECEISGREKTPYSIWNKMRKQNIGFHNLHDIMAFRIVTNDIAECYRVLGVVNTNYNMIPGSFKDYISTPKENGYRSLHSIILGPFNKKIEAQIRDQKMHEFAELGVASHWRYKEGTSKESIKEKQENEQYRWIRDLLHLFETSETAAEVLKDHKLHMHKDEVFCFTPNGDIFNLPYGSTVVDFAYAIHSEVGNSCVSAKVNGIIAPLRKKLENGDQVEIVTSDKAQPSPNWLQFVNSSKSKNAIKNFIRSEKFGEYSSLGRAILNKFFASKNLEINDKLLENVLQNFQKQNIETLCAKVAEGIISRQEVLEVAYPDYQEDNNNGDSPSTAPTGKRNFVNHSLAIEGLISGMAMNYAGCCNPIPGDAILGIINTGTGVTIHSQSCRNLRSLVLIPQRVLDVCWKAQHEVGDESYLSRIKVVSVNKFGSLAVISSIIANNNVNIRNIATTNRDHEYFEILVDLEVKNVDHLEKILSALRISKKIVEVVRLYD